MKCINIYNKAIGLFIILLCLNLISCLERKKIKKVKKVKSIDPNNFAIAVLLTKMGSKLTIQKIVNKLGKKCKNLKILQRTKTSLRWLRNKFGYIRKALRKNKVNENVRQTLYKNFYSRLFNRLLKCTVISGSKAGSQLKKAVKMLKKGKKLPEALKNIRNLVNLTDAKAEPQKGFFHALRKYYKFLERKKQIKKENFYVNYFNRFASLLSQFYMKNEIISFYVKIINIYFAKAIIKNSEISNIKDYSTTPQIFVEKSLIKFAGLMTKKLSGFVLPCIKSAVSIHPLAYTVTQAVILYLN